MIWARYRNIKRLFVLNADGGVMYVPLKRITIKWESITFCLQKEMVFLQPQL